MGNKYTERHKTSRRPFRNAIIEKYGLTCTFCGEHLVDADMMPKKFWVELKGDYLTWKTSDGTVYTNLFLTMEHLVPISCGGKTTIENVVPACQPCNHQRMPGYGIKTRKPRLCKCGRRRKPAYKRCEECHTRIVCTRQQLYASWCLRLCSQGIPQ
jgi:hypothetical protein